MALCAYLLLAALLTTAHSWVLTSTHSNVLLTYTEDVILQCSHEINGALQLAPLSRIRLLKLVDKQWKMYAEILHPNTSHPVLNNSNQPGVYAEGRLGRPNKTYLKVKWSTASNDTVGSYKCEVDGFMTDGGTNHETYTRVTNITNNPVTLSDLVSLIAQMKRKSEQLSQELQSMESRSASQRQVLKNRMMSNVESSIKDNFFEVRYWPVGSYTLLTDANGCPNTPFSSFRHTFATVQTKTNKKPQHVFPPGFNATQYTSIDTRNVLRFDFCNNDRGEPNWFWPRGTYCIHRYRSNSHTGFGYGYTRFYLESLTSLSFVIETGTGPYGGHYTSKYIDFYFLCRSDGNASIPILLPTATPFYLYRYGGKCQEVYNMDVTNRRIEIDTDDTKTGTFGYAYHADGTTDGVIQVCYYTKKNSTQKADP